MVKGPAGRGKLNRVIGIGHVDLGSRSPNGVGDRVFRKPVGSGPDNPSF